VGPRHWVVIILGVFYVCGVVCVLLFAKENGFHGYLGDPYGCPRQRALLVTPFLLSINRGKFSETGLVLGPCMTEEIEGALWPIYGIRLGGQY
jgi:hypothetical protein